MATSLGGNVRRAHLLVAVEATTCASDVCNSTGHCAAIFSSKRAATLVKRPSLNGLSLPPAACFASACDTNAATAAASSNLVHTSTNESMARTTASFNALHFSAMFQSPSTASSAFGVTAICWTVSRKRAKAVAMDPSGAKSENLRTVASTCSSSRFLSAAREWSHAWAIWAGRWARIVSVLSAKRLASAQSAPWARETAGPKGRPRLTRSSYWALMRSMIFDFTCGTHRSVVNFSYASVCRCCWRLRWPINSRTARSSGRASSGTLSSSRMNAFSV
mmetsp:Transcript_43213/g.133495  ORF Transcript_43213/g.133495 Transcript_43213/m.133495 type:complete len:277 (-) Transcript_43213:1274-2104(-)